MTDEREPLWSTQQTADHLNVSLRTMFEWRKRGYGPPWVTLVPGKGGLVRYDPAVVRGWVEERTSSAHAESAGAA